LWLISCHFVFPDRVICVFCKKILCLQAEDFFAIASSEGRRNQDCSTDKFWGWVKKLSFLIASNLKTISADFPEIYLEISEQLFVNRVNSGFQLRSCFVGKAQASLSM